MRDEQDESLSYLSLDGTCDVARRMDWREDAGGDGEDERIQITWDTATTERCFGWPSELIESTLQWWTDRIHPDDRLRVVSSLNRALYESKTARYWSETYRFQVYDGGLSTAASTSAVNNGTSSRDGEQAGNSNLVRSSREQEQEQESSDKNTEDKSSSAYDSDTPQSGVITPIARSSNLSKNRSLASSPSPSNTSSPSSSYAGSHNISSALRINTASHHSIPDPQSYITVLDQLYISRRPSGRSLQTRHHLQQHEQPPGKEESSEIKDAVSTTKARDYDEQFKLGNMTTTSENPPIHAIGALFSLEQRIKTAEALHNPRALLMRSISNISSTTDSNESSASSSANAASQSSSSGSFVSVPSTAGGGRGLRRSNTNASNASAASAGALGTASETGMTPLHTPSMYNAWAHSPVSSPTGSQKAFSFLDVEGVRTILENTQSGLTMVDAKGKPTYFNTAGAAITGYANIDELRAAGKDLHYALHHSHPDGSVYPAADCPIVRSMATLTRISNQSDTFFRKDGLSFPVVWSCSPISKMGKSIGAVLEFRDVTEEKKLEKEKIKATLMTKHQEITIKEANASKQRMTQFLDYIAHELRNPLHGIAANIEFLRDSLTALQASFNNVNTGLSTRPDPSPLQQNSETGTPPATGSGRSVTSQSAASQSSSSLRSASGTSSASSHSYSAMRLLSPKVDIPSPSAITSAALSSAVLPARGEENSTKGSLPKSADPTMLHLSESSSSSKLQDSPTPRPTEEVPTLKTLDGTLPPKPTEGYFSADCADDKANQLADSLSSLAAGKSPSSQPDHLPSYPATTSSQPLQHSKSRSIPTGTPIEEAAHKQFQAHFDHSSTAPPPWQAEDKKSELASMSMSPLLADITKHTTSATAVAKQIKMGDATKRFGGTSSAIVPPLHYPHSPAGIDKQHRKTVQSASVEKSIREDEVRGGGSGSSGGGGGLSSPSPSSTTILASEADTELAQLSNQEIQQVLQTSQSFITSIRECVFHATHITNNVLDLSRFEAGKVELLNDIVYPARVASLAVDMMMARAQEKDIELVLEIPEEQTLVRGDGTRLAQVFLNLLSNAIKFTPRGGKVTLRFKTSQEKDRILLKGDIIDTGMGMSKSEMSNLFQRFGQSSRSIQAEYGGTGLGLSICQEIVTLQGGKMSVQSEKGKGSTFSFTAYYQPASDDDMREYMRKTPGAARRGSVSPVSSPISESGKTTALAAINAFIPAVTASITGQSSPSGLREDQRAKLASLKAQLEAEQATREPFRFKHILVAEDNGINQNIMKNYLKKLGYRFTIVVNGQEVLDTFVNKTHEEPIDVILMDCEMPVMDGRQATEHIRQHEHFRKNLVTPLDSPFNLQLGAAEINNLQATPPSSITNVSYSPPLSSPTTSHASTPGVGRKLHRTPIIGLSGNARQELVRQAMASGMDDYVVKPFKLIELEKVLRKWEQTIDDQLVQRDIAVKAKEFLDANSLHSNGTSRKNRSNSTASEDIIHWQRARSGSGSSTKSHVSDGGVPASPKPVRPPLLSTLSASRLPYAYSASPDRAARPKLPSRLSNEWIHQVSKDGTSSGEATPPSRPERIHLERIDSEPDTQSVTPPLDLPASMSSPPASGSSRQGAGLAPSPMRPNGASSGK